MYLLTRKNKIGLVIAGLLGLSDLAGVFTLNQDSDSAGPPLGVLIFDVVLGAATIAAVIIAWRRRARAAARAVALTRIVSTITSLPAFFAGGVPAGLVAAAGAGVVVTLIAVALVISKPRAALVPAATQAADARTA
jgi:hypothetical protein